MARNGLQRAADYDAGNVRAATAILENRARYAKHPALLQWAERFMARYEREQAERKQRQARSGNR
ncbi:MAG: hypothetical protein IT168_05935 [Bryobacterales bacterium]|nr:hypothetical protein [Bryobacterales bacterium]